MQTAPAQLGRFQTRPGTNRLVDIHSRRMAEVIEDGKAVTKELWTGSLLFSNGSKDSDHDWTAAGQYVNPQNVAHPLDLHTLIRADAAHAPHVEPESPALAELGAINTALEPVADHLPVAAAGTTLDKVSGVANVVVALWPVIAQLVGLFMAHHKTAQATPAEALKWAHDTLQAQGDTKDKKPAKTS